MVKHLVPCGYDCFGFGGSACKVLNDMVCKSRKCSFYKQKSKYIAEAAEGERNAEEYLLRKRLEEKRNRQAKKQGKIVIKSGVLYDV